MIGEPKELRFLVDRRFDSLINSAEDDTTANDIVFFEGDSQRTRKSLFLLSHLPMI